MRRYWGIGLAWLAATLLSVVIASAAVAGIRDRVAETPVALGAPTTTLVDAATSTTFAVTTSPETSTTATTEPQQTTTTDGGAVTEETTTTTTEPATTTSTTTTTTTTTTQAPSPQLKTYSMIGGTVTLSVGSGQVTVASAVANPGFTAEIERNGPTEVKVEFESNTHKSELTAHFENGELDVSTSEEDEDDHDGDD